jgi:hypothetical protein
VYQLSQRTLYLLGKYRVEKGLPHEEECELRAEISKLSETVAERVPTLPLDEVVNIGGFYHGVELLVEMINKKYGRNVSTSDEPSTSKS